MLLRTFATFAAMLALASSSSLLAQEEEAKEEHAEKLASYVTPLTEPRTERQKHPLYPALKLAEESLQSINENVQDYTCNIVRRERIEGQLRSYEFMRAKVRHPQQSDETDVPFSVYLRFEKPASVEGREALYVEGEHAGKVFVRRGGQRMSYMSTYIKPDSPLAMRENRYPITDIGFKRMIERLVEVIENDIQYDECEVKYFEGAKVGDRKCTRIEVIHPVKRDHFTFYRAMVFVDDEDKLPVGYAAYYWPREEGGPPRLLEEYIYTDVKLNVGLTDEDFDRDNPDYEFSHENEEETAEDE
ncbi:DUF1571 domain-containing protein [Aeoliella mucimassa]|nr:DUF1571 domain-containing protein [Aeoliella mucimassa]